LVIDSKLVPEGQWGLVRPEFGEQLCRGLPQKGHCLYRTLQLPAKTLCSRDLVGQWYYISF